MHRSVTLPPEELTLSTLLSRHRAEWDRLAALATNSTPFMGPTWIESFCEAFTELETCFLALRDSERLVGLAPFIQTEDRLPGMRLRVLESLCNEWKYRYSFLAPDHGDGVLASLWEHLLTARRWDVIRLDRIPERSGTLGAGLAAAETHGWRHVVEPLFRSPWKALPDPPNPWDQGLKSKFKSNLRNREKRLGKLGDVEFQVASGAGDLPAALEVFYELEARGWKGEASTAIREYPPARQLFDGVIGRLPGSIWIPTLCLNGQAIAAQLIQVQGDEMFLLKVGYHPEYRAYSPGQLITARTIIYGLEHGMRVLDFLGEEMTWKSDWCHDVHPNYRLVLYAPTARGRLAYWVRHGIRERARKIPGASSMVKRMRSQQNSA